MMIQSDSYTLFWLVMCRLSTVTLIVEKYTLTLCYYMCWFFKVTMILSLIKVASYIQALYMYACTYSADYNESALILFNLHNIAVPKFFKMFSIVQMMFTKEVIFLHDPLLCWTTWLSLSISLSKTNIIIGNLPLFYWRIFYKYSLIEFAPQRCFIMLFSFWSDSLYTKMVI